MLKVTLSQATSLPPSAASAQNFSVGNIVYSISAVNSVSAGVSANYTVAFVSGYTTIANGMIVVVTGMANPANNGTFHLINVIASNNITLNNTAAVLASVQTGTATATVKFTEETGYGILEWNYAEAEYAGDTFGGVANGVGQLYPTGRS